MLSNANFIILDEPTNHLDIQYREILEEAINNYEGTVFYVSHDRYFINQTATRILDLSPEGIVNYKGNYNYYLEQKEAGNISADSDNITLTSPQMPLRLLLQKKRKKTGNIPARKLPDSVNVLTT